MRQLSLAEKGTSIHSGAATAPSNGMVIRMPCVKQSSILALKGCGYAMRISPDVKNLCENHRQRFHPLPLTQ